MLDKVTYGIPPDCVVDAQPTFFGDKLGETKPDRYRPSPLQHGLASSWPMFGRGTGRSVRSANTFSPPGPKISKRLLGLLYESRATPSISADVSSRTYGAYYLTFSRATAASSPHELNQIPEKFSKYFDYACSIKGLPDRVSSFRGVEPGCLRSGGDSLR